MFIVKKHPHRQTMECRLSSGHGETMRIFERKQNSLATVNHTILALSVEKETISVSLYRQGEIQQIFL